MVQAYYWIFYSLYQIDPFRRSSEFDKRWKTLVFLSIAQFCAIGTSLYCAGLLLRSAFVFSAPRGVVVVVALAIMALNYRVTLYRDRWKKHAKRFEVLPPGERRKKLIASWVAVGLAIGAYVMSSYAYRNSEIGIAARQHALRER